MVYTENSTTWACCDQCGLTMFAGFNAQPHEVRGLSQWGWTFGKRILCPYCGEKSGAILPDQNKYRHVGMGVMG